MQDHNKPGVPCLACREARRQKKKDSLLRQAVAAQPHPVRQQEPAPAATATTKAGPVKLKSPVAQDDASSVAVVGDDGHISSVAAAGSKGVPVEGAHVGERPKTPFSKAAAQQQHPSDSGSALHAAFVLRD